MGPKCPCAESLSLTNMRSPISANFRCPRSSKKVSLDVSFSPWRVVNSDLLPDAQIYGVVIKTHSVFEVSFVFASADWLSAEASAGGAASAPEAHAEVAAAVSSRASFLTDAAICALPSSVIKSPAKYRSRGKLSSGETPRRTPDSLSAHRHSGSVCQPVAHPQLIQRCHDSAGQQEQDDHELDPRVAEVLMRNQQRDAWVTHRRRNRESATLSRIRPPQKMAGQQSRSDRPHNHEERPVT